MASSCALSFIVGSPLPVLPKPYCAVNVRILCTLVATAQQKNNLCSGLCIVETVASAGINTQFPHSFAAESMVSEVALFESVDALDDLYLGNRIAQLLEPFENWVFALRSEVVTNFVHTLFSSINE